MARRIRVPTVVIAGKFGAGKSTLVRSLLDIDVDNPLPSVVSEKPLDPVTATRNGSSIHVIDTAGLGWDEERMKERMRELSVKTKGKADVLVYCMPVGPGHKVVDANPMVMKCLTEVFSKKIWKHSILVLTYSNVVWDNLFKRHQESTCEVYKAHIKHYVTKFQKLVEALGVEDNVTTIFQQQEPNPNTIVAIPVGLQSEDPVLPGISDNWRDFLFNEILRRCDPEYTPEILKLAKVMKGVAIGGAAGGVVGGVAAGAVAGGMLGVVGGPPGMIAGAVVGGVGGGVAGGVVLGGAVGGIGAVAKQKIDDKNKMKKFKEAMNDN